MQIIVPLLTIIAILRHHESEISSELIEELGCHNTEFRLSCGSLNANIVIFEATFFRNDSFLESLNKSCGNPGLPQTSNRTFEKSKHWDSLFHLKNHSNGIVEVSFRHAINRRCSGVNYCSFVLSEDIEAASSLGPGVVYLRYACVEDLHLNKPCNSNIDVTVEGFGKTPGYPDYYIGESTCMWTLRAPPPQRVKVAFLDVSLRGVAPPYEGSCLDWLIVTEDGLNLLSTCGDISEDILILSDGPALNISFKSSSKTLFPKRGFLFHYKAVGCPSLRKPRDGYLINRNETFAHYKCCLGFVFPDTLSRDKTLNCYNENTWDGTVFDCVNVTELLKENNYSTGILGNLSAEGREAMENIDAIKDVVVPSVIMCVIFIGNGILLYFIYRQRKKLVTTEKMELKEFSKSKPET